VGGLYLIKYTTLDCTLTANDFSGNQIYLVLRITTVYNPRASLVANSNILRAYIFFTPLGKTAAKMAASPLTKALAGGFTFKGRSLSNKFV
jgi:hypothetical protein